MFNATQTLGTEPLTRLLVDTCVRLDAAILASNPGGIVDYSRDRTREALVTMLLDDAGPAATLVAASLLAVHSAPGVGGHLADLIDRVASAERDRVRGERVDLMDSHDGPCSWEVGCDVCEQHWDALLDDAVRDLRYLLGDAAVADLLRVDSVGRGAA